MPTLNILPAKAIWLYQLQPDTNKFNTAITLAWLNVQLAEGRPIFHFDLSAIPTRYATLRATLELDPISVSTGTGPCDAYRVTQTSWSRTQATWNSYVTGFLWTAAGGDYDTAPDPGPVDFTPPTDLDILPHQTDLTVLAEDAIQNRSKQLHFLIRRRVLASPDSIHEFHQGGAFFLYPRLVVNYEDAAIGRGRRGRRVPRIGTMPDRPAGHTRPAASAAPDHPYGAARPYKPRR